MDVLRVDYKDDTWIMFKDIIVFICGLIGFILTCSEVKSFGTFQEIYVNACDLNLELIKHQSVRFIYKLITVFVVLTRKYSWYPYIIAYFLMLCGLVLDSKRFFALWLLISAIRSLLINIIVMFTGLSLGFISHSNVWALLDFGLFKTFQIGISAYFWYAIWTQYSIPSINNSHNVLLSRKRAASFHGFESSNKISRCSTNSTLKNDSVCEVLNDQSHQSDHEFVNTVQRKHSLDYIVNRNMVDWFVKEANTIDEDSSSLFSFGLAIRAEKFLQLTPEEIANASKSKKTEIIEDRSFNTNALLKLQPLPTTDNIEMSEIELNVINISKSSENSFQMVQNEMSLTPETLLSIFYKYHYYKPAIVEELKD